MSGFVVVGGLLLLGILLALVLPLVRGRAVDLPATGGVRELNLKVLREQQGELERDFAAGRLERSTYEQAKEELARRTLDDAAPDGRTASLGLRNVKLAVGLVIFFPALVFGLYSWLGTPGAMRGEATAKSTVAGEHPLTPEQISAMVEKLAVRLQDNPEDGQGWLMLGRSYAVLGRYPEAAAAFDRALSLLPPDAQHYADFADITAMTQGRTLEGAPEKLVRRALEIDPTNIKALALSGTVQCRCSDFCSKPRLEVSFGPGLAT